MQIFPRRSLRDNEILIKHSHLFIKRQIWRYFYFSNFLLSLRAFIASFVVKCILFHLCFLIILFGRNLLAKKLIKNIVCLIKIYCLLLHWRTRYKRTFVRCHGNFIRKRIFDKYRGALVLVCWARRGCPSLLRKFFAALGFRTFTPIFLNFIFWILVLKKSTQVSRLE